MSKDCKLKFKDDTTNRGFAVTTFEDLYQQRCRIQKSSLATTDAWWIGVENSGPIIKGPNGNYNEAVNGEMHLSKKQIRNLIDKLEELIKE